MEQPMTLGQVSGTLSVSYAKPLQVEDLAKIAGMGVSSHIVVSTYAGVQTIPDKQLAAVGTKRSSCIRLPYFGVALQCLPGTDLVLN